MKSWNTLIVTILYLPLSACVSTTSQMDEKLLLIDYCDLIANPSQYNEQVVRVSASHFVGWEWSYLADEKCFSDSSETAQTWIMIFDDAWCENERQTEITLPRGYDRSVALQRKVIVVGTFYNSRGGPRGSFYMDLICLEKAEKWQIIAKDSCKNNFPILDFFSPALVGLKSCLSS